jgi:hypothetical protein
MVHFETENPNLGKFLEGLGIEKVGIHILWSFEIF